MLRKHLSHFLRVGTKCNKKKRGHKESKMAKQVKERKMDLKTREKNRKEDENSSILGNGKLKRKCQLLSRPKKPES